MDMNDSNDLKRTMVYIRKKFGREVFTDQRLIGIFRDLAPGLKNESRLLNRMLHLGIMQRLSEVRKENDYKRSMAYTWAKLKLVEEEFIREEIAAQHLQALEAGIWGWYYASDIFHSLNDIRAQLESAQMRINGAYRAIYELELELDSRTITATNIEGKTMTKGACKR